MSTEFTVSNDTTATWSASLTAGATVRFKINYEPWLDATRGERLQSFTPTIPTGATGTTFAGPPATVSNIAIEPNPRAGEFLVGGPFGPSDSWQVQINVVTTLGQVRNDVLMCSAVGLP